MSKEPTTEEIEKVALESAANMGTVVFDHVESRPDGTTHFYDGDRVSMIIPTKVYIDHVEQMKGYKK